MTEMTKDRMAPIHPGELLTEILDELNVSAYALAKAIGKAPIQVSRILAGKSSVTADMARLISGALGTSAEMWLNIQSLYDLELSKIRKPNMKVTRIFKDESPTKAMFN
jgi:addiction module HigA family antidote